MNIISCIHLLKRKIPNSLNLILKFKYLEIIIPNETCLKIMGPLFFASNSRNLHVYIDIGKYIYDVMHKELYMGTPLKSNVEDLFG